MVKRIALSILALMLAAAGLSACGKRGDLERPEGSTFPRQYPPQ
ncbi:MAG: lipoprotein [Rhodospirillaceae bacterium]|nr:lipoprotein [Rhodospirillaceae bacterium]